MHDYFCGALFQQASGLSGYFGQIPSPTSSEDTQIVVIMFFLWINIIVFYV